MANPEFIRVKQFSLAVLLLICAFQKPISAQSLVIDWAKSFGGSNPANLWGASITSDALGNVYTVGYLTFTADFDPGSGITNLTAAGGADLFISKLDASGNFVWAHRIGGAGGETAESIVSDAAGNLYITGSFSNTVDFDPGAGTTNLISSGSIDIYILKLNSSGIFQWARKIGGTGNDYGSSITLDPSGNVLFTGLFSNTVDFDPGAGITNLVSNGIDELFVAKFDATGSLIWAKSAGGTGNDSGHSIATDATGNAYITGSFSNTVDFDPGTGTNNLTANTSGNTFILKLNADGSFGWARNFSGALYNEGNAIAVNNSGVIVAGLFGGTVDFDPGTGVFNQTEVSSDDFFICKLDVSGNFLWAHGFGGIQEENANGIAVDASGNTYTTGHFAATVDFDPGSGVSNLSSSPSNTYDIYILKLDASGNFIWVGQMGGVNDFESGETITIDGGGTIYTTGNFYGTADLDPNSGILNLTATGSGRNVFIQKLKPPIPTITSFTPSNGSVGTAITITGTNFSATPTNNIVYFGATQATVTVATPTQLIVTVPVGATYQPISVLVNGLAAFSSKPFITTFADGGIIDACSFAAKVDVTTGSRPYSVAIGDLDADGKADLAVANETSNTISVYKNISTLGSLGSASFETKVDFVTGAKPYFVAIQDLDGDGKPELIATSNSTDKVSLYKNNTTPGVINSSSFAAKVDFSTGQNPWNATIADFDQDGKPDLAVINDVDNTVSILKNTSSYGIIDATSFAPKVDFVTGNFPIGIASGDLDGDGKMDLAITNQTDNSISVLRNISTTGIINASSFAAKIDFPAGLDPYSVAIGDLDDNNKPEIVVSNYSSGSVSVFGNTSSIGSIALSAKVDFVSGAGSLMVSISDIDGDGKPDLLVTNGSARIAILKNLNTAPLINLSSFANKIDFNTASDPYGLAIGDLDGNGKPDIVGTNFNGTTASILRNTVSSLSAFTAASFSPTSGPVGTIVTITGINFSTTPINNTVKFNGVVATVTSSTATSITAIVPVGAVTGSISLEIGCMTAFTVIPFTVTSGNTITITIQPSDFIACAGDIASFNASATGTTNITYQWQFSIDGVAPFTDINNGGGYSGATTTSLTVNTAGNFGVGRYRCRINGDFAAEVISNDEGLFINPIPSAPLTTGNAGCSSASLTLSASGGTNGQYRWYTVSTGGVAIVGEVNSTYTTPVITSTTTYYVSLFTGSCESTRTPVIATINPIPVKPILSSSIALVGNTLTICSSSTLTLSAPNGFATYSWSNGATTQQITVSATGTYSVTISDAAGCVSPVSDLISVTVVPAPCNNQAPVITATLVSTTIGGLATINLLDLISDSDNNLVLSSLVISQQPASGAPAAIVNNVLEIDYKGVNFSGRDQLTIQVCDVFGECTQQVLEIDVIGDIEIYNGISPNKDDQNEIFLIRYIELLPDTQENNVSIFNRWGSKVFEVSNYNNTTNVFRGLNDNGNELPSGTYFYKIEFNSGRKSETGYLTLRR